KWLPASDRLSLLANREWAFGVLHGHPVPAIGARRGKRHAPVHEPRKDYIEPHRLASGHCVRHGWPSSASSLLGARLGWWRDSGVGAARTRVRSARLPTPARLSIARVEATTILFGPALRRGLVRAGFDDDVVGVTTL